MSGDRTALITGANRGIGFETARQLLEKGWQVWVSARSFDQAEDTVAKLSGGKPVTLDVMDDVSVAASFDHVHASCQGLHTLVNNAGIDYDTDQRASTADLDRVRTIFETNFFGAWRVSKAAAALLGERRHSVIVNVSSGAGSIAEMGSGTPGYSTSKAALNALTRQLAADLKSQGTLVNAVCPGWVATDMGGGGRAVSEGAAGIVWAAMLEPGGPTGGFFRDGTPIAW